MGNAGAVVTLILSDVIGNPLDVIASGPTVPDPTTFQDALAVLDRYDLRGRVAAGVRAHLEAGAAGGFDETPKGGAVFERQLIELVADAGVAARAGFEAATLGGWVARVVTTELAGEAREVGTELAAAASGLGLGEMLVLAGETTVTVTGDGRGGRNQELALAASIALADRGDIVVLSLGTDGIDGMSRAAGAFADGTAVARGAEVGLDAADYLARNDSATFLEAVGDAVICGPTGTNVGDLILVCRTG
jgi:hydroxypyruvate reductase